MVTKCSDHPLLGDFAKSLNDVLRSHVRPLLLALGMLLSLASVPISSAGSMPFLSAQGSTIPSSNSDVNPYGVAQVPVGFPKGTVRAGQLLVSNFNNSVADGNTQGAGSTIVTIDPSTGQQTGLFFQGTPPIGFTNALGIVKAGFVFAGSITGASSSLGLLVFDSSGNLVSTITTGTNGPWGLAIHDEGQTAQLFVSNVLDGTVTRIEVSFKHGTFSTVGPPTTIASGYAFGPDSAGLVVGPAGLAYNSMKDILYVASESDDQIYSIAKASKVSTMSGKGTLVYSDPTHLHGPLGLIIAPNGNLIAANADPAILVDPNQPSELVEFTTAGTFVRQFSIDPNTGSAFAILNVASMGSNQFAYVDDFVSSITVVRLAK